MLHSRDRRIEEAIHQALSHIFQNEMNDPRLPEIFTITQVKITRDLKHAKAFYSQLPDDEEALARTRELLTDSAGYLRSCVAREVNLRFCPTLSFAHDASPGNYQRISSVLEELRNRGELGPEEDEEQDKEES